jgi:hypothetical protein
MLEARAGADDRNAERGGNHISPDAGSHALLTTHDAGPGSAPFKHEARLKELPAQGPTQFVGLCQVSLRYTDAIVTSSDNQRALH